MGIIKMKKLIAAFMALAMLVPLASCSQESKYSLNSIKLSENENSWSVPDEKYKSLLESYGGGKCPGTMVVATDEDVIYLYCEDGVEKDGVTRVSQDTVFDIASCSKTFTAVCILRLAEKGKLDINDTLDKYFPEYEAGKNITISNLLHMSSGIPDYINNPDPFWNISGEDAANQKISDILQDRITDEEFLNAMYQAPLAFDPGTQYEYSNTNYRLLAFIIENVTGMKYCDYVKKNIFDKCGMKNTTSMATGDLTYVPQDFEEQVLYGFSDKDGYPACPNNSRGDGGIHSNLTDMVAFDRALFTGKLLNQDSMKILFTEENGYCCGLVKGQDSYSHTGSSISCSAYNKAIESEEFGHIYIIRLEHSGMVDQSDAENPMAGTNYTKGVFENGVYTNEYAELKVNIPEELDSIPDEDLVNLQNETVMGTTDTRSKAREAATVYDAGFWANGPSMNFYFLNSKLGVTDDPDYTAEDFMEDYMEFMVTVNEENGVEVTISDPVTVNVGGKEYLRFLAVYEYQGAKVGEAYEYFRKLDDDLILQFDIGGTLSMPIEEYEKLFG